MKIETRKVYDVLVVDLSGRLDSHSSGDAGDRIVEDRPRAKRDKRARSTWNSLNS
jgi:hypothetical protein